MKQPMTIALDGMGGDNAPDIVVQGANLALKKLPSTVSFKIYGDATKLTPLLKEHRRLNARTEIIHTDEAVLPEDKPSFALRHRKNSSMKLAVDAVGTGDVDAVVSAGNTGALMALSLFSLRTIENVSRPAICSPIPNPKGATVMLDLGANVECDADNLVQFAVMGSDYARTVLGIERPTVGLLNIGSEEIKGRDEIRLASEILKSTDDRGFDYYGFVEGDDLTRGTVDVVVTDGFTGNVALKSLEGFAKTVAGDLKSSIKPNPLAWLGVLLMAPVLWAFKKKFDPRLHNGAVLAGLNGIVVKSHGSADAKSFASAVHVAYEMVEKDYANQLKSHI